MAKAEKNEDRSVMVMARHGAENPQAKWTVTFTEADEAGLIFPHDDPLVISCTIDKWLVKRSFVDNWASINVVFMRVLKEIGADLNLILKDRRPIKAFGDALIPAVGSIRLNVSLGKFPNRLTRTLTFVVLDLQDPFNVYLGRPALRAFHAVTSIPCLALKRYATKK